MSEVDDGSCPVDDPNDLPFSRISYLQILDDPGDVIYRFFPLLLRLSGDRKESFIVYIHLHLEFPSDFLDGFSTLSDHFTDLFLRYGHAYDEWCERGELFPRGIEVLGHILSDRFQRSFRLGQHSGDDFHRKPFDLAIHLQCCDPVLGPSHFEVHISEEIFLSLDISEDLVISGLFIEDHSHRHSGYDVPDGDSGIHERHR